MKKKKAPPAPAAFGDSLAGTLKALGLTKRLREYEVLERWPSIVGEKIAAVTEPSRIEDGTLTVHVKRAAWRNELTFLKQDLRKKINEVMGEEIVTEIIFR